MAFKSIFENAKTKENKPFVLYMSQHCLFVDVWKVTSISSTVL